MGKRHLCCGSQAGISINGYYPGISKWWFICSGRSHQTGWFGSTPSVGTSKWPFPWLMDCAKPKIPQVLWRVAFVWHPYQGIVPRCSQHFFRYKLNSSKPFCKKVTQLKFDFCTDQSDHHLTLKVGSRFFVDAEPHRAARPAARLRRSRARPRSFSWIWRKSLHRSQWTCEVFLKIGYPQFSSMYRWIFHALKHPATGVPPCQETPMSQNCF